MVGVPRITTSSIFGICTRHAYPQFMQQSLANQNGSTFFESTHRWRITLNTSIVCKLHSMYKIWCSPWHRILQKEEGTGELELEYQDVSFPAAKTKRTMPRRMISRRLLRKCFWNEIHFKDLDLICSRDTVTCEPLRNFFLAQGGKVFKRSIYKASCPTSGILYLPRASKNLLYSKNLL